MSLNFSSPVFLFGLLGISIPILIHILTRRQQKHIHFSAVYLLFQSQKRSIKKSRPNKLLLLLLRCLGIILFSMAMANPLFSLGDSESFRTKSPSSLVIILDDSYSMKNQTKEKTLFKAAIQFISKLLLQIPEESELSLILASSPARIEQQWISQKDSFEKIIRSLQPSFKTTDIAHAIDIAAELLSTSKFEDKNLILLTDMDKNGWDIEAFKIRKKLSKVSLQIFDFSTLSTKQNQTGVKSVKTQQEFLSQSQVLKIKTEIKNYSEEKTRSSISLVLNKKLKKETLIDLPAGQTISKEFSIPIQKGDPVIGSIKVDEDALTTDNIRYFAYNPNQNIKVLIVDGDPVMVQHQSESFYIERALNPFSVSLSYIDPVVSNLTELPTKNLSNFSVVILANVRELPTDYELELENFVLRGGALIIGMGDQINAKYYNEKLGNLLPVMLEAVEQYEEIHMLLQNNKHPVMQAFSPQSIEEMKDIPFYSIYTTQAREGKKYKVANWFNNQNPAVIENNIGNGKVVVFLSSLDRDWNDFPIQPTFLPWLQRWTQYAARGLENMSQKNLLIGETFQQNIYQNNNVWAIKTPDGNLKLIKTNGEKATFNETYFPGVYSIFELPNWKSEKTITKLPIGSNFIGTFTINIDTKESSPQKIDEETVKTLLPNLEVIIKNPELNSSKLPASQTTPLATPLILLVVGILVIEGWMVRSE